MSRPGRRLATLLGIGLTLAACAGPRKQLRQADQELATGDALRAARLYDSVRRDHPDQDRAWTGAARAWLALHDGDKALDAVDGAVARGVGDADLIRGAVLVLVGRGAEAVPLLADTPDDDLTGRLALADAWLAAGDPPAAAASLAPLAAGPPPADALLAWATWQAEGAPGCPAAADLAGRAAEGADAAEDGRTLALATAVLTACDRPDQAARFAERARIHHRPQGNGLAAEADRRTAGGDPAGAARLLAMAIVIHPDDGRLHRELGVRWLALDRPALAEGALEAALPLAPYEQPLDAHTPVIGGRGMSAEERASAAADLWQTLARSRASLDDAQGAAAARERALLAVDDSSPESAAAWAALAMEWARLGLGDRAEIAARTSIRENDHSHLGWLSMALAARAQRNPRTALGAARSAWERSPGDPAVAEVYADAAIGVGETDTARRVLESALLRLAGAPHPLRARLEQLLDLVE